MNEKSIVTRDQFSKYNDASAVAHANVQRYSNTNLTNSFERHIISKRIKMLLKKEIKIKIHNDYLNLFSLPSILPNVYFSKSHFCSNT